MKKVKLSKEIIKKSVEFSQKIEGYKRVDESIRKKVKMIKTKYNVKVSLQNR